MSQSVSLAAEYLLLMLDPKKGGFRQDLTTVNYTVAAAEIVQLVSRGVLVFTLNAKGERILKAGENPPADEFFATVVASVEDKTYDQAIGALVGPFQVHSGPKSSLRSYELEHLVSAGILREEQSKLLGLIPRTRYPEADSTAERDLRARLDAVFAGGQPDPRSRALIALLYGSRSLVKAFPNQDPKVVKDRARQIADASWEDHGLTQALGEYASYMAQVSASMVGY